MELNNKEKLAKDHICLALDTSDLEEIKETVHDLKDLVGYFKIHTAFTNHGPQVIQEIKKNGGKIFLDLKFHDIPNTVAEYARAAARFGVDIFNLHASGGHDMMKAAVLAAREEAEISCTIPPKIIAVTVLTSLDEEDLTSIGMRGSTDEQVLRLAELAKHAGCDGIVCSAADLGTIRKDLPEDFFFVTPGIRPVGVDAHDQKRVMTPKNAIEDGSSLLVIGRAIMGAENKKQAAYDIIKDIASKL